VARTVLAAAAAAATLETLKQRLVARGFLVRTARDGEEVRDRLRRARVDAVVVVTPLPGVDAVTLVEELRRGGDETQVLLAGDLGEPALRLPGLRVLPGPIAPAALLTALAASLDERR
jgi:DNA-binding response OmpR family regulator